MMPPHRILFVNSWSTAHGGSSTSLIDVVVNLDRSRYDPLVMCPSEGELPERLRQAGIPVLIRGIHRPTREEVLKFISEVPRHWRWLRSRRIALVHGNTSASRRSIVQASVTAGVPYVQHVRNVVREPQTNYGYHVARRIICNSDATAAVFRDDQEFSPKTVTLYNAVDLSRYELESDTRREELGASAGQPIVGFVGQLVPRKGVITLINALPDVLARVPNALLAIVGCAPPDETKYEAECRARVSTLGLDRHVRFVGYRKDVPAFMRTFDVFALPTRSEPFGKVVIEAMAAGCPVVATRVGGIPEIVTGPDLGTLVVPDDSAAIATAVIEFLASAERRRRVSERGAASARARFGMSAMLRRLEDLYDEVLDPRRVLSAHARTSGDRERGAA